MLKAEIRRLSDLMTISTRTNGNNLTHLKNDTSDKDKDLFRDFHGTDMLPDDFRFDTISTILSKLLEYDYNNTQEILDNYMEEIIDSSCYVYNQDLTNWLSSNLLRSSYPDQAFEHGLHDGSDIIQAIKAGQYLEIEEIFNRIHNYLEEYEKSTTYQVKQALTEKLANV